MIPITLNKDIMPYFDVYMFMVEIWVYCGPPEEFGRPKMFKLPIFGTQIINPG